MYRSHNCRRCIIRAHFAAAQKKPVLRELIEVDARVAEKMFQIGSKSARAAARPSRSGRTVSSSAAAPKLPYRGDKARWMARRCQPTPERQHPPEAAKALLGHHAGGHQLNLSKAIRRRSLFRTRRIQQRARQPYRPAPNVRLGQGRGNDYWLGHLRACKIARGTGDWASTAAGE